MFNCLLLRVHYICVVINMYVTLHSWFSHTSMVVSFLSKFQTWSLLSFKPHLFASVYLFHLVYLLASYHSSYLYLLTILFPWTTLIHAVLDFFMVLIFVCCIHNYWLRASSWGFGYMAVIEILWMFKWKENITCKRVYTSNIWKELSFLA